MYSFSVLAWQVLSLDKPFVSVGGAAGMKAKVWSAEAHRPNIPPGWHAELRSALTAGWHADPAARLPMAEFKRILVGLEQMPDEETGLRLEPFGCGCTVA